MTFLCAQEPACPEFMDTFNDPNLKSLLKKFTTAEGIFKGGSYQANDDDYQVLLFKANHPLSSAVEPLTDMENKFFLFRTISSCVKIRDEYDIDQEQRDCQYNIVANAQNYTLVIEIFRVQKSENENLSQNQ